MDPGNRKDLREDNARVRAVAAEAARRGKRDGSTVGRRNEADSSTGDRSPRRARSAACPPAAAAAAVHEADTRRARTRAGGDLARAAMAANPGIVSARRAQWEQLGTGSVGTVTQWLTGDGRLSAAAVAAASFVATGAARAASGAASSAAPAAAAAASGTGRALLSAGRAAARGSVAAAMRPREEQLQEAVTPLQEAERILRTAMSPEEIIDREAALSQGEAVFGHPPAAASCLPAEEEPAIVPLAQDEIMDETPAAPAHGGDSSDEEMGWSREAAIRARMTPSMA